MMRRAPITLFLFFLCWLLLTMPAAAQEKRPVLRITAEELATAVASAKEGDTIEVESGTFNGSLQIDKSLTLIGKNWPIIDGQNNGTVVNISAPDTTIRGFVIKNSGQSLDHENSGIAVVAPRAVIENNRFEGTLFGIYLKESHNSIIRGNQISSKDLEVQRRGDAIRLWYSTDVLIEDNVVQKGRDVVLWYSERLLLRNNRISDGRYGLHFMYCDDARIESNLLIDNSVGAFLMYSRRVHMRSNTIAGNRGPSGYGVGLKDMDDTVIMDNLFIDNRIGAHLDTSPREVDSIGEFSGNVFAYNDIGVELMPSVRHNLFSSNSFVENEQQVAVAGGGTILENSWTVNGRGNYWSDYAGYDADGNGQGDLEYRSERLFENLMEHQPLLRLFIYSPASNAIDFAARAFPLVKPKPKLVDASPQMTPALPQDAPLLPQTGSRGWIWLAMAIAAMALGLTGLPYMHWRRYTFKPQRETKQDG